MRRADVDDLVTASLIGTLAGMRSMLAPAVVSRAKLPGSEWVSVDKSTVQKVASAAALLEVIGDKWSFVPARTRLIPLMERIVSGGLSAFWAVRGQARHRVTAAIVGMTAAALSSQVLFRARRFASEKMGIPNATAGILEDSLALATARFTSKRLG